MYRALFDVINHRWSERVAGWAAGLNQQSRLPTLRTFVIGFVAVWLVIAGMARVRPAAWFDVAVLTGSGILLWLWRFGAWGRMQDALVGRDFGGRAPARIRWWVGSAIYVAAGGLAVWNWRQLSVEFPTDADWLRYLASVGLLVAAAAVMDDRAGPRAHHSQWRAGTWLLVGIFVAATVVRFVSLDTLPFGVWYDEAANGLESLRVAREPAYRPIYTDGVNATGHYLWLIVGAFSLFGENIFAVRSISATMGVATVVVAYFAGRELHGQTFGLVAAALLAVARWSITFSRLGMYNSATPLFELLSLYWLLRGLRRGSMLDYTCAGLAIGLGLCFYAAFQLFLAVLGIFIAHVLWRERARWRTVLLGVAFCAMATAIVMAPLGKFVLARPDSYFARVQTTSLFADKAPDERLPALWQNTRKHLLMFNVQGDPNGRHNLPGEPMLDWVSGGLLVLGVVMCLRRGAAPRFLMLPVWIVVGLLGGILSLDFEAPQALRAIGALPAVFFCAALPPTALIDAWRQGAGRYAPAVGVWLVTAALVVPAAALNLHTYFVRQARDFAAWNAHSTPETIAAHLLREADPAMEKYVISLYDGHPTVRFLAQGVAYRRVETNATLPLLREMPGGMLLVLDTERQELYQEARRLYPGAAFEEIRSPYGGPVVVYVNRLTASDLQSIQGLAVTYLDETTGATMHTGMQREFDIEWPAQASVALPFVAEWQGILAVNMYGPYQFFLQSPGKATLWIGETAVIDAEGGEAEGAGGGLMLARGHHSIRLRVEGGQGRVRLAWQPPDGPPATIPPWALYIPPVHSNGLLGTYYANGNWEGDAAFAQIDPRLSLYFHVPTLPRPYTVEWQGKIAIPTPGQYEFALQSIDESSLYIDGVEVAASRTRNEMSTAALNLAEGLHDVVVRYADRTDHTYINLLWRAPGGDAAFRPIPTALLFPPQESYDRVDVGNLARFIQSEDEAVTGVVRDRVDPAMIDVVVDGLREPRGIAVHEGLVYVAEAGNQRVRAYDRATGEEVVTPFDGIALDEPFDVTVTTDNALWLLDARAGQLLRYDAAEATIATVPVPAQYLERSRGIGPGLDGELWIANTAGQRIAAVDASGAILHEIVLPPVTGDDREMQPIDVARMADDTLYVTDVSGHLLYRFGRAGFVISSQPIPIANSLDGAHLAADGSGAVGAGGALYMTEPEAGNVVKLDAEGASTRIWHLRSADLPDVKPVGIAVADDGIIWIADSAGGRLLRVVPQDKGQ